RAARCLDDLDPQTEQHGDGPLVGSASKAQPGALVRTGEQLEKLPYDRIRQGSLEAIAGEERTLALVREKLHRQVAQVQLPFDAGSTVAQVARHREGILGPIGFRRAVRRGRPGRKQRWSREAAD